MKKHFAALFILLTTTLFSFDGWLHLELGAGNYGKKQEISSPLQYQVLYNTLDELVDRMGSEGVFQVNDIDSSTMQHAISMLQTYAEGKGYDQISIEDCCGDYFEIDYTPFLDKHGREKYDSIHLKNPEPRLYKGASRNHSVYAGQRAKVRTSLQRIANFCHEGLYFFPIYMSPFFPDIEKQEFVEQGIFYQQTDAWEPMLYHHPDGRALKGGTVLFIPRRNGL